MLAYCERDPKYHEAVSEEKYQILRGSSELIPALAYLDQTITTNAEKNSEQNIGVNLNSFLELLYPNKIQQIGARYMNAMFGLMDAAIKIGNIKAYRLKNVILITSDFFITKVFQAK